MKRRAESQFLGPPEKPPNDLHPKDVRKLLGLAAAKSTDTVMKSHFFSIKGGIYKQRDGAPIGLDVSVEIASLYMTLWDRKFLSKCKKAGINIHLYKRYVDDTFVVLKSINKGWKYDPNSGKLVFQPELENSQTPDDLYTFLVLQEIANSINVDIQMDADIASNHQDGHLPVLDLELKVVDNKVKYLFYSKPCSSPFTILYRSALSAKQKRETLLQEGLRRLRNCSIDTEVNIVSEIMSQYMYQLHISGYDLKFRHTILKGILDRREKLNQNVANGIWTRFRSKNEILEQKNVRLGKYPATWFLKGGKVNTLKVIPTPISELKNKISNKLNSLDYLADGGPTRVIELGGNLISRGMGGTENFGGKGSCHMGASCFTDPEHDCRSSRAVYSISCENLSKLEPTQKCPICGNNWEVYTLKDAGAPKSSPK